MIPMKRYALPLLLLPISALATEPAVTYRCDDGSSLDVLFSTAADGRNQAMLTLGETTLTLPQVPAASGALYRANDNRLHTKGDEALFEDAKGKVRHCKQGDTPPATATPTKRRQNQWSAASSTSAAMFPTFSASPCRRTPCSSCGFRMSPAPTRRPAYWPSSASNSPGGRYPISFQTTVDRDLIGKRARITAAARIERGGKLLFISDKSYPVIRNGQAVPVEMTLKQVTSAKPR
jgi:putative lipoprotein